MLAQNPLTPIQTKPESGQGTANAALSFYSDGVIPVGDVIWVFGTDTTGKLVRGDAKIAANHFGAKQGVISGATGQAYAIPTRNSKSQALPIAEIAWEIAAFKNYARSHPEQSFFVSRVGNGMAGLDDRRIAPHFNGSPTNCAFPQSWRPYLNGK